MRIFILFILFIFNIDAKKALIFGVTGQDGSYLSRFLLGKGYEVHGIKRRSSSFNTDRIDAIIAADNHFFLHYGDITDPLNVFSLIKEVDPDEIYNLAAQSHVAVSFQIPIYTSNVILQGTQNILEAIRLFDENKKIRFYHASTSEMFGNTSDEYQNENTQFKPQSPYAIAKVSAHNMNKLYRESYGIYACNGILFNHESPYRGETFVTKKITMAVAKIKKGFQDVLYLGNLNAKRDFGYAKDYVEVMWLMLQQNKPDDYVIGTGKCYTVREFVERSFSYVGIDIRWRGEGFDEQGYDAATKKILVKISKKYFRPKEVDFLRADTSKAYKNLGWKNKTEIDKLISKMIDFDLQHLE